MFQGSDILYRYRVWQGHRRWAKKMNMEAVPLKATFSRSSPFAHDAKLTFDGKTIHADILGRSLEVASNSARRSLPTFAYWLAQCKPNLPPMTFDLCDGNEPSLALFSPSTNKDGVVLLPDAYFFRNKGFVNAARHADKAAPVWADRRANIRWRGAATGDGRVAFAEGSKYDVTVKQRLRMAMHLKDHEYTDFKFIRGPEDRLLSGPLFYHGYGGERIAEMDWVNDRFAIDVDGNSNTWSNFIIRMHLGCCVLKVDSQFGFKQWYYDRLAPWEHFVPVKADLSDLLEQLEWVRSNDKQAQEIAKNGQLFARSLTFESETKYAVREIEHAAKSL